ncbi:uncharacterized protein LOC110366168 isoform X3 [Columba livia]|uniref:uncharacterized protein LOC110366168 isoform X3 n=1 Tax=Columba livia TaxID=8932 RepID=UPI0031BAE74C
MDWKQTSRDYGPQGRSILLFGLGKTISSPAAQLGVREDTSPLLPLEPVPVPATAQHHPTLPRHRGQAAAPCPRDTAGVTSIPCELPLKNQNVTDTCATSRCPGAAGRPLRCGWERRTNHAEDEQSKQNIRKEATEDTWQQAASLPSRQEWKCEGRCLSSSCARRRSRSWQRSKFLRRRKESRASEMPPREAGRALFSFRSRQFY